MCVYVDTCAHVFVHSPQKVKGQLTRVNSHSSMWVLGLKLWASGLMASTFTQGAIWPANDSILLYSLVWP